MLITKYLFILIDKVKYFNRQYSNKVKAIKKENALKFFEMKTVSYTRMIVTK